MLLLDRWNGSKLVGLRSIFEIYKAAAHEIDRRFEREICTKIVEMIILIILFLEKTLVFH